MKLLAVLILFVLCGCKEPLVHDLDETQANELRLSLVRAGIPAYKDKEGTGWSISVDEADLEKALQVMGDTRFLRSSKKKDTDESSGFMQSREQKKLQVLTKLGESLEGTIETLPDVEEARVHLFQKLKQSWQFTGEGEEAGSASVLVITSKHVPYLKQNVARIVAGGVGISTDYVNVVIQVRKIDDKPEALPQAPQIIAVAPDANSGYYPVQVVRKNEESKLKEQEGEVAEVEDNKPVLTNEQEKFPFSPWILGLVVPAGVVPFYGRFLRKQNLLRPKL